MAKIPVILITCGSAVATSSLVASKLETESAKRKLPVSICKGKAVDADKLIVETGADIIISTAAVKGKPYHTIPTFSGMPLLTGIGQAALFDDIFDAVKRVSRQNP